MVHLNLIFIDFHCLNQVIDVSKLFLFLFSSSLHNMIVSCAFFFQAAMMFSSGVFWMGLLCIPMTALLFDVVYKV